jgi:hypothetical protein
MPKPSDKSEGFKYGRVNPRDTIDHIAHDAVGTRPEIPVEHIPVEHIGADKEKKGSQNKVQKKGK